jgi:curli biogenesis system outer membrane secretion channel CsgG
MILVLLLGLLLLTGCSNRVKVQALQPAKIDRAAKTKTIAVHQFSSDSVGLSSKIEASLASKRIEGENYFTMISRSDVERIFKEQRLQNTGLLDERSSVQVGNLLGAQALISGVVSSADSADSRYSEKRQKCADKACKELYEYTVPCTKRSMNVAAQVKMVDIEKGDIIYSDMLSAADDWYKCSDDSYTLPSASQGLERLSSKLALQFTEQLTPSYLTLYVVLLDDPDTDYSDEEEKMLENALIYIDHERYEKAEDILSRLLAQTHERSYVAAYDLGVLKEIKGELEEAKQLYALADGLTVEPVEEIDLAVNRIKRSINNRAVVQEQMNR